MKANFGHTEGASGIAALIKTVMVLEKGIMPPIANLETLNRKVQLVSRNLEVSNGEIINGLQATDT